MMESYLSINSLECKRLLGDAEEAKVIFKTKRPFVNKQTMTFVSLRLEILSH